MRAAALCAIALLLALVVAPPVLEASVLLAALHDAGHVLVFALIGALLCLFREPRGAALVAFFAVAAALAVGTEVAQPWLAGSESIEVASLGDVGRDLLGAAVGALAWRAVRHRRRRLWFPAAMLLAAGLAPRREGPGGREQVLVALHAHHAASREHGVEDGVIAHERAGVGARGLGAGVVLAHLEDDHGLRAV